MDSCTDSKSEVDEAHDLQAGSVGRQIQEHEKLRRSVLAFIETCPTCGGTGIKGHGIDDMGIRYPIDCPTCGPLRAAAGVK